MSPLNEIIIFNTERGLTNFNAKTEFKLLEEELTEFATACETKNEYEMVDALCDLIVVATGGLFKLGYDPTKVLSETTKEIRSRRGTVNSKTGKWEKDRAQDPATLYKAKYVK